MKAARKHKVGFKTSHIRTLIILVLVLLIAFILLQKPGKYDDTPRNFSKEAFIALLNASHTGCEVFSDNTIRDACIQGMAISTYNLTLCNLIQDAGVKAQCKAVNTKDVAICNTISNETQKSRCIRETAWTVKDPEMCDTPGILPEDQDTCIYTLAKQLNDMQLCNKIASKSFQEHCKKRLATTQK